MKCRSATSSNLLLHCAVLAFELKAPVVLAGLLLNLGRVGCKGGRQFLGGLIGDDGGGRATGLRTVLVTDTFVRNNVTEQFPCLAFEARHADRLDRIEISWASVYLDAVKNHRKLDVL